MINLSCFITEKLENCKYQKYFNNSIQYFKYNGAKKFYNVKENDQNIQVEFSLNLSQDNYCDPFTWHVHLKSLSKRN